MHRHTPVSPDTKLRIAIGLHREGRLDEAAETYRQILQGSPNHATVLHLLGAVYHALRQFDAAVDVLVRSLQAKSENVKAINLLGCVLKDQGRPEEAEEIFQSGLAMAPHDAEILANLGLVKADRGDFEGAIHYYREALARDPQQYATYSNLGNALKHLGRTVEAVEALSKAAELNPRSSEVMSNLGIALLNADCLKEAGIALERALQINPRSDIALTNYGALLKRTGALAQAVLCYQKALEINPRSLLAHNNYGNALKDMGRYEEALDCFHRALELDANDPMARNNLGVVLGELQRKDQAVEQFARAVALKPDYGIAHSNLGSALSELGRLNEALEHHRKAVELLPHHAESLSNLLFTLNYLGTSSPEELFEKHLQYETLFGGPLRAEHQPHSNDRDPQRRLKIGYVSGDFIRHSVASFVEPILKCHDRNEVEVFAYFNRAREDEVTERLKSLVDHWRNIVGLTDRDVCNQIREDQIDILIDLSGHTAKNRLLVFARKPAPVQVTMIGYMQTTGLSAIDYRITDKVLDPVDRPHSFSSEKLIRLEAGAAPFLAPQNAPEVSEPPFFKNGYFTFGSFNNLAKVTDLVIETWAEILRKVPDSKMIIVGRAGNDLLAQFATHGIGPERLDIRDRMPMEVYLKCHHEVDLVLDAFPYNGGTTSLIAAWMGVPFVTLIGETTLSRVGAGILSATGLGHLIADRREGYIDKAVVAATQQTPELATWREQMRPKMKAILDDGTRFTREFETALRAMWSEWCNRNVQSE